MEVIYVSERMDKVWIAILSMLPHSSILGSSWSLDEQSDVQEGCPHVLGCAYSNTEESHSCGLVRVHECIGPNLDL